METLDIKFTKFDNRPWGFRLAGGSDFPQPLTVIRVSEGSLSECMGLKVGDVVVKLNDQPISELTHGQAHEALTLAGNNFVLGVRRTADPDKLIEGIEENAEPYMLPIEEILFAPVDEQRETTPDEVPQIEDESVPTGEENRPEEEIYPEKPRDENSDPLPKTDLTEEEIAQLILDEEEVLNEKGVLGVNFKKLRPRATLLKESKVFKELQQEAEAEPEDIQERKRQTTFLQKPERPVPKSRKPSESEDGKPEPEVEPYRVVIKKQPRKPITQLLLAKGLIDPKNLNKTPEPSVQGSEVNEQYPDECTQDSSESDLESVIDEESDSTVASPIGTWSFTSSVEIPAEVPTDVDTMLPIDETQQKLDEQLQQQERQFEAGEPVSCTYTSTATIIPRIPEPKPESEPAIKRPFTPTFYDETVPEPEPVIKRPFTPTFFKEPVPEREASIMRPNTPTFFNEIVPVPTFIPLKPAKKQRLCRRGRYAKRCLNRALESLKSPAKTKPRLLRRAHYFERIVGSIAGVTPKEPKYAKASNEQDPDSLINVLMLASLAYSLRDTYDNEILHRGSSRRNSRRMSTCRRESKTLDAYESGLFAFRARKDSIDNLKSFQSRCAEGRRRLSVMGMVVADKVSNAMRTDLARGLAYAMVPCASALAFYMFNYMKRYNNSANE